MKGGYLKTKSSPLITVQHMA